MNTHTINPVKGWSSKQKKTLVISCRNCLPDPDLRYVIMRQFPNAFFDKDGKPTEEPTSTSSELTQKDFERMMSYIESFAGGKVKAWPAGYWERAVNDQHQRLRFRCVEKAAQLERLGLLKLGGFIRRMFHDTDHIEELNGRQLYQLMEAINAMIEREGVAVDDAA